MTLGPMHETQATTPETGNFNDAVLVKITEAGEKMWDDYHAEARIALGRADAYQIERDEEGYTSLQLHQIAHIFGSGMYNGNPKLPIDPVFKFKNS